MTEYTVDYINELISSNIGNREALDIILESINSGKSLTSSQTNYLDVLEKSRYHLTELAKSIQSAKNYIPKKESTLVPPTDILSASELIKQNKFEITTLTSLLKSKIPEKQHINELKSKQRILQKEITHLTKEIEDETDLQENEMLSINEQLSQLTTEENELVEKIDHEQKLRVSQERELEELRLERLNIVNKNKDTRKIEEQVRQHRNRLDQITYDRSMLELEIKSQMNLLEEEHQKERDIVSKIIRQYQN